MSVKALYINRIIPVVLLFGLIVFLPLQARAACSNGGVTGAFAYTSAAGEQVPKYCNGTDWVPWAGEPVTGAPAPQYSGASVAGSDRQIQFNSGGSLGADTNFVFSSVGRLGIGDTTPDVALDVVGNIHYTGQIMDVSDIRMKYDIEPLDNPLSKLTALNGISFKMKGDESKTTEYGVSAQDVQKVFPELVHEIDTGGTLGVNYNGLMAPMIEAIKELESDNEMLKEQNMLLRARLDALEKKQQTHIREQ